MSKELFLIIMLTAMAIATYLGWLFWRSYWSDRNEALKYDNHSLVPPPSTVCPQCRRRSYSKRAVAERYCGSCDLHY